jgi:hypothetical protein
LKDYTHNKRVGNFPEIPAGTILPDGSKVVVYLTPTGKRKSYRLIKEFDKVIALGCLIPYCRLGILYPQSGKENRGIVVHRERVQFGS